MKKLKVFQPYIFQLVLIITIMYLVHYEYEILAIIVLLVDLVYSLYLLYSYKRKEHNTQEFIRNINEKISDNLGSISMPIVLIKENGEIIWYNNKFKLLDKEQISIGGNIIDIISTLDIEKILDDTEIFHQRLKIREVFYDVTSRKIQKEENVFRLLCFNDVTELIGLDDIRESVVLIEVDNLVEVLDTTDEEDKPLVVAEIERTINAYAHRLKAMSKKYDTNKYVLSVQDRYIKSEIENNFSILDEISKIDKGNKLNLTLSIGIGRNGLSPQENNDFATVAKELALGRGGDQVVIKSNDEIKFFGANTKEFEKRTRVRARVISHALKELIYESSKVFIVGHMSPDMDCFGSAVALSSTIIQLGKETKIVLNDDNTAIEYFLNKIKNLEQYHDRFISGETAESELDDETLIIVVDVHNKSYVSNKNLVEKAKRKVIIDHHRRSPDIIEGTMLNYIEVYASSTSEMITEIVQYIMEKPKLSKEDADGLLAGIYMDTKNFSFKTGVRTFEAASFLRNRGGDTVEVKKMFADTLDDYLLIAETIKSAKLDNEGNTAIAVCPDNVDTVIIAKAADELLNISGILASFVLANINGDVQISGRSIGDINVQIVLEALGGGGHMNIAGTKILNTTIDEVMPKLEDAMAKYLRVGEQQ